MDKVICEVEFIFKDDVSKEKVEEYLLKVIKEDKFDIIEVKGNKAIVYVYMRYGYDEDEIEIVLFEILEGGNLGECDYWEVEED